METNTILYLGIIVTIIIIVCIVMYLKSSNTLRPEEFECPCKKNAKKNKKSKKIKNDDSESND